MNYIFDWDKKSKQGILKCNTLDIIREHFSVENKIAKIRKFYGGNRFIPTRKYTITPNGKFDIGLFKEIYKFIQSLNIPSNIVVSNEFAANFKTPYNIQTISPLKLELREYQTTAIEKCFKQGNGVVVLPTASGKTLTMAALIQSVMDNKLAKVVLVIVPSIQLVEQTYHDFIQYGIPRNFLSKWSGNNELKSRASIIIAGSAILQSAKQDLSILESVDLLIVDEVHKLRRDNEINKLLKKINTFHRFGFTGTLPEEMIDQWNIIGKMGPIIYEKTSDELRTDKYISNAIINVIKLIYRQKPNYSKDKVQLDPTIMYEEEIEFLHSNNFRNSLIAKISNKLQKNTLIMVDRIAHGEVLLEWVAKYAPDKSVYFIRGAVEIEDREKIRKLMEKKDNIVCIAISSIFSTGINIKNLHNIIFASAGKAKVKIIQSIGRGLRLHESKDMLFIYDIADMLLYGTKHLQKRIDLYDQEKITVKTREIIET